jgi:hypothetical protein
MLTDNEKVIIFTVLDIHYRNGEKCTIDYDYRKKVFNSRDELDKYKKYLEKKLDKELYLTYKHND